MFETGHMLWDVVLAGTALSPLVPFLFLLVRQRYRLEHLNYLMILCLVSFLSQLFLFFIPFASPPYYFIITVIQLIEAVLLLLMMHAAIPYIAIRNVLLGMVILGTLMSITLLISSIPDRENQGIYIASHVLIFAACTGFMYYLMEYYHEHVTGYSLFWVGVGSGMFSGVYLIQQFGSSFIFGNRQEEHLYYLAILGFTNLFKMACFTVASFCKK